MDNSTHNRSEEILRYLDGEMNQVERKAFEQQLLVDDSLREELENLKLAREAVRIYGLKEKIAAIHKEMAEKTTPVKKMGPRRMIRYTTIAAASIILIVGGIFIYNLITLSPTRLFNEHYQVYELTTMRDGDSTKITAVEKAYRDKDYRGAIEALYKNGRSALIKDNFLGAMSYSNLGNSNSAAQLFIVVMGMSQQQNEKTFQEESEYYLALNYIRAGYYSKALSLLKAIRSNPEHLYHEKVSEKLIRQVKRLSRR